MNIYCSAWALRLVRCRGNRKYIHKTKKKKVIK